MKPYFFIFSLCFTSNLFAEHLWQIYQQAKNSNAAYQANQFDQAAEQINVQIVRSALYPKINLSAGVDRTWLKSERFFTNSGSSTFNSDSFLANSGSSTFSSEKFNRQNVNLNLRQPLYNHSLLTAYKQAQTQGKLADIIFNENEQSLMLRTAAAYFDILAAKDELGFRQTEKKAILEQLVRAQALFNGGISTITDVYAAQALADQATASEINAQTALGDAKSALREILVGLLPENIENISPNHPLKTVSQQDLKNWIDKAIQNSPQLSIAKQQVKLTQQQINLKRAGHYPTLDLTANYRLNRSNRDFSDSNTATLGIEFVLPLYAGGGVNAETSKARLAFQSAQQILRQTQYQVERQVRDAYRRVDSSISQINALKTAIKSAEKSFEATKNEQQAGTKTTVDVLIEQSNLFRSKRDYAKAKYQNALSYLALKKAVGLLSEQDLKEVSN